MNTENTATKDMVETYLDTEGTDDAIPNQELEHIKRAKIRLEDLWANEPTTARMLSARQKRRTEWSISISI